MQASSYTIPAFREILGGLRLKTMLEVGSMHGMDAIDALKAYSLERVVSVEANPECAALCRKNLAAYPQITLVEAAAWFEDTVIPFFPVTESYNNDGSASHREFGCNIGASSCFRSNGAWPHEQYVQKEIRVPARRLDAVLENLGVGSVDLICMDVQGAALHALEGLGRHLDPVQAIVTELELQPMYDGQSLAKDVDDFLLARGFALAGHNLWSPMAGDFLYLRRAAA